MPHGEPRWAYSRPPIAKEWHWRGEGSSPKKERQDLFCQCHWQLRGDQQYVPDYDGGTNSPEEQEANLGLCFCRFASRQTKVGLDIAPPKVQTCTYPIVRKEHGLGDSPPRWGEGNANGHEWGPRTTSPCCPTSSDLVEGMAKNERMHPVILSILGGFIIIIFSSFLFTSSSSPSLFGEQRGSHSVE